MTKSYNVVLVGESGVGKTSLVKKFLDPSHIVTPSNSDGYWDWQESPPASEKSVKVDGKTVNLSIVEVPGSKGRMSNFYEMKTAMASADLVLFCYSAANQWTLNSLEHTVSYALKERQSAPKKVKTSRFKKAAAPASPVPPAAPLPIIAVQLFSETGDLPDAATVLGAHTKTILKASALEGTGIQEVFQACAETLIAREKEMLQNTPAEPAAPAEPTAPVVAKEKEGLAALWGKLMAKFVSGKGGEEALVQQTPADAAPVA